MFSPQPESTPMRRALDPVARYNEFGVPWWFYNNCLATDKAKRQHKRYCLFDPEFQVHLLIHFG